MSFAKRSAVILLVVLCLMMISCELPGPWVTVFSDDFNRVNSDDVGNGWSEVDLGGTPPGNASIDGQALLMMGGNSTQHYMAILRSQSFSGDFRVAFSLAFPGEPTFAYVYVTTAALDYYAMGYQPGVLGTWKDGSALGGSISPAIEPTHDFMFEARREGSEFTVVLTDTTTGETWTSTVVDGSYLDFTAIHLKAGYYDTGPSSVLLDDFHFQTR
jgi:hypothetical protein